MLQMIIKSLIKKHFKPKKRVYVEQLLYPKQVYPIYLEVRDKFKFCVQNRLIKRPQLLEFKKLINSYIDLTHYKNYKWTNDMHEIYKKLKDTTFTKKQMLSLKDYLEQFI